MDINLTEDTNLRSRSILPSHKNNNKKFFINNEISFQQKAVPKLKRSKGIKHGSSIIRSPQSESTKIEAIVFNDKANDDMIGKNRRTIFLLI